MRARFLRCWMGLTVCAGSVSWVIADPALNVEWVGRPSTVGTRPGPTSASALIRSAVLVPLRGRSGERERDSCVALPGGSAGTRLPARDQRAGRARRRAAVLVSAAPWDTLLLAVSSPVTTAAGALILSRHPRHAIGWLLVVQGLVAALGGDLAQGWGLRAADQGWPLGPPAEFVATASWLPTAPLGVAVLLLFPTGRLLSRRWSLVLALSVIGVVLAEPAGCSTRTPARPTSPATTRTPWTGSRPSSSSSQGSRSWRSRWSRVWSRS